MVTLIMIDVKVIKKRKLKTLTAAKNYANY